MNRLAGVVELGVDDKPAIARDVVVVALLSIEYMTQERGTAPLRARSPARHWASDRASNTCGGGANTADSLAVEFE